MGVDARGRCRCTRRSTCFCCCQGDEISGNHAGDVVVVETVVVEVVVVVALDVVVEVVVVVVVDVVVVVEVVVVGVSPVNSFGDSGKPLSQKQFSSLMARCLASDALAATTSVWMTSAEKSAPRSTSTTPSKNFTNSWSAESPGSWIVSKVFRRGEGRRPTSSARTRPWAYMRLVLGLTCYPTVPVEF